MFDYITCDLPLPELPEVMLEYWGTIGWQTKDTPNQAMSHYNISKDRGLQETKIEGYYEEADYGKTLPYNFPKFIKTKEWVETCIFSGSIRFYQSWKHPDEPTKSLEHNEESFRFVDGWVEYSALFDKGHLIGEITLQELRLPHRRTDEELAEFHKKNKKMREQIRAKCIERRKNNPTPEERLIASIFEIANNPQIRFPRPQIRKLIEEYREKHDPYYGQ